jgi:hypothetical protein
VRKSSCLYLLFNEIISLKSYQKQPTCKNINRNQNQKLSRTIETNQRNSKFLFLNFFSCHINTKRLSRPRRTRRFRKLSSYNLEKISYTMEFQKNKTQKNISKKNYFSFISKFFGDIVEAAWKFSLKGRPRNLFKSQKTVIFYFTHHLFHFSLIHLCI